MVRPPPRGRRGLASRQRVWESGDGGRPSSEDLSHRLGTCVGVPARRGEMTIASIASPPSPAYVIRFAPQARASGCCSPPPNPAGLTRLHQLRGLHVANRQAVAGQSAPQRRPPQSDIRGGRRRSRYPKVEIPTDRWPRREPGRGASALRLADAHGERGRMPLPRLLSDLSAGRPPRLSGSDSSLAELGPTPSAGHATSRRCSSRRPDRSRSSSRSRTAGTRS